MGELLTALLGGGDGQLNEDMRAELKRLRAEAAELRMDCVLISNKAAA